MKHSKLLLVLSILLPVLAISPALLFTGCFRGDDPGNPQKLIGNWRRGSNCPGNPGSPCVDFCELLVFTPTTLTVYNPGLVKNYSYTTSGNKIVTTPGNGTITYSILESVTINGYKFPERLTLGSTPNNCDLEGSYTLSNSSDYFADFTIWHATHLNAEVTSNTYLSDALGIAADLLTSISDAQLEGPEAIKPIVLSTRFSLLGCATATFNRTGTQAQPAGTITLDFNYTSSNQCYDGFYNTPGGTIVISYAGKKFNPGSTITITYSNFTITNYIGAIKIDGTYQMTSILPVTAQYPRFTVVGTGGKTTFQDGTTFTAEQSVTYEWQSHTDQAQNKGIILAGGTKTGTTRDGKSYNVSITKDLEYQISCQGFGPATSGEETFTSDSKPFTVTYSNSSSNCNISATITINGRSRQWLINGNGQYPN